MPWFSNLFGGSSKPVAPLANSQDAIHQNRDTISRLEKKIKYITEKQINPIKAQAKELMKKKTDRNRAAAKKLIAKMKMYEKQITQMESQIMNLEGIRIALEGSAMTQEVFSSMSTGAKILNNTLLNGESVDEIFADTEEALEKVAEVSDLLAAPISVGVPIDDDDLEAELNDIMEEDDEGNSSDALIDLPEVPISIPSVPNTSIPPHSVKPQPENSDGMEDLIAFANN